MTFDEMIEQAWDDHADHADAVADRLAAAAPTIAAQAHFAPFARIVTHVYGEHLGDCERGVALLTSLRTAVDAWQSRRFRWNRISPAAARGIAIPRGAPARRRAARWR